MFMHFNSACQVELHIIVVGFSYNMNVKTNLFDRVLSPKSSDLLHYQPNISSTLYFD
jgi:hypothetical protein